MTYELFFAAMNILWSEGKSRRPETITAEDQAARITFAHLILNPPEHNLPAREKTHWKKQYFGTR